jgi:hypothetical protein
MFAVRCSLFDVLAGFLPFVMNRTLRLAVAAALPLALLGCHTGYDVNVRNLTDEPVTARLQMRHSDGAPQTLAQKFIGIGDTEHLSAQRDSRVPVSLEIDAQGDHSPATLDLTQGATSVTVRRNSEPGKGRLMLEASPRP